MSLEQKPGQDTAVAPTFGLAISLRVAHARIRRAALAAGSQIPALTSPFSARTTTGQRTAREARGALAATAAAPCANALCWASCISGERTRRSGAEG